MKSLEGISVQVCAGMFMKTELPMEGVVWEMQACLGHQYKQSKLKSFKVIQ